MDIRFNNLASLHWLWALLVLAVIVGFALAARKRRMLRFAASSVLARLVSPHAAGRRVVRAVLVLAAMFLLVVGLLDPRWGVSYQEVRQEGIDIFVVFDVSRSMRAEDARPNRLDRARLAVRDLLEQLQGDRIGLITFAGTPAVSCPLTIDYGAFALSLAEADPRWAPKGGSNLGDAIRLAGESFTDDEKEHKAVIVFSDGEDHDSYPVEAASRIYEEKGIQVHTVGIGDADEGARIPVEGDGTRRTYLTHDGQEVWSVMNASMLKDVALSAGGAFIPVGTGAVDIGRVYQERIAPTTRREYGTSRVKRYHVKYQWFAAAALVLLLVESLVSDRRGWLAGGRLATATATCLLASVLVAAGPSPVAPEPTPEAGAPRLDLDAARTAFEAGDFALAAELYDQARELLPDSPEVLYNLGVARYRNGEYEEAARRFEETVNLTDRDALRSSSLFNLGNAAYARSRDALAGMDEARPAMEQLEAATERLGEALDNYRQAIDVDPSDEDAKVNGENAWRLLKQLQEMQEQLQQQQQQDQDQDQEQEQEEQDQQQQQQQQQQDQQDQSQDEQQQEQQEQGEDEQQQQQQEQQDQQEQQQEEQEPQPQPGEEEQDEQEQEQPMPQPAPDDEQPMTEDEARRLLQMVRDKERQRREEQLEAAAEGRDKVDKDW